MPKLIVEIALALALTVGAIFSFAAGVRAEPVAVTYAYARASAVMTAKAGTAYFTLVGRGEADRLIGVSTPAAASAMLHESKEVDGVATMSHIEAIDVPAEGKVVLAPGGLHVMLMGLKAPLEQGQTISLNLNFEKAGTVSVAVPVGSVSQDRPSGG